MASLAEIRARLQAADNKSSNNTGGGDKSIYPHWNMEEGQSALLRFLPDGNGLQTSHGSSAMHGDVGRDLPNPDRSSHMVQGQEP